MLVNSRAFFFCMTILFVSAGLAFSFQSPEEPAQPAVTFGGQYQTFQAPPGVLPEQETDAVPDENPTGDITLDRVRALGLMQNPELAVFSWEIRTAQARTVQAGLPANPEMEATVENFGGDNDREGFTGAETTVQISQLIELGGKRAKRKQVAALEKEIVQWEHESKRLDVLTVVTRNFWDVVAAQEQWTISGECAAVAEAAYNLVAERVKAGKAAPLEEIQSRVTVTMIRIEEEAAKRELQTARQRLAAAWGSNRPMFEKAVADMEVITPPPSLEQLAAGLSNNPDLARWNTEMEKNRAQVRADRAGGIPDLTVGAGPRYYNESDDMAFVATASFPIPLYNRNQGAIQEARFHSAGAIQRRKAAMLKAQNDLEEAYQILSSSYSTADSLMKTAIPAAKSGFEAALEGYREGKLGYPAVLETQRIFFEIRRQCISAILNYHKSKADIERLIGQRLSETR